MRFPRPTHRVFAPRREFGRPLFGRLQPVPPAGDFLGDLLAPPQPGDGSLLRLRVHWQRYRELSGQGRHAEAGKELDAIGAILSGRN